MSQCIVSYVILSDHIPNISVYTPFYLLRRQPRVFSCHTINHSKHRFCLIRVYVRFATEQPSFSQQNSSLLLLSFLYPLFSSNLFSSRPPFQPGSSWIDISEPPKGGGRRRDSERRRERERRMQGRRLQMQTEGGTEKVKERKE